MKDEFYRILNKKGWTEDDKEELITILHDLVEGDFDEIPPDILEYGIKELFKGKGSVKKRLKRAKLTLNLSESILVKILNFSKSNRRPLEKLENPFPELIIKASKLAPWDIEEDFIEELRNACDLSNDFKREVELNVHPYIVSVVFNKKNTPVVVDGSNFLWKHDLAPTAFEELFFYFSTHRPVFYPFWVVFDKNVKHIVPWTYQEALERILKSKRVYQHSPADELIISLAREKKAVIMSDDKFKEYDTHNLKILRFPI